MEEGVVIKPAEAGGKSKQWVLIAILILFLIAIVGLVIWIVFGKVSNDEQKEVACEEMDSNYKTMSCLSHEGEGEELDQRYDAALKKAIEEEDYEFFDDLVFDRSTNLVQKDECEKTLSWLDSIESKYTDDLPVLDLYGLYASGQQAAHECNDSEKMAYYQNKMDTVMASDAYHEAVANDDYRVYGVDIFVEGEE